MIKSPPGHSLISIYCIVILGLELSVRKSLGNLSCLSHFHRISAFAFLVTFPWDIIFQKLFISTLAACRIIFYCRFPYLYGTQWYLVHNLPWHRAKEELISEKETNKVRVQLRFRVRLAWAFQRRDAKTSGRSDSKNEKIRKRVDSKG